MDDLQKKVLLYYKIFDEKYIGGSEYVVLHAMESMKGRYDLTLITEKKPNWEVLNRFYQTSLSDEYVRVLEYAPCQRPLCRFSLIRNLQRAFRFYRRSRFIRDHAAAFDLRIAFTETVDFGASAFYYFNFGNFAGFWKKSLLRRLQYIICNIISRYILKSRTSEEVIRCPQNHMIANSQWVAEDFEHCFGRPVSYILYPPVVAEFSKNDWFSRESGFVCVGRVAQDKGIDKIIEILEGVRNLEHPEIHLHIGGWLDKNSAYVQNIIKMAEKRPWVTLEGVIYGNAKKELFSKHRFALHDCPNDAFGISVAEYVKAGCVPFVPNQGGSAEIVGIKQLQFGNIDEAVKKIIKYLDADKIFQQEILQKLEKNGLRFDLAQWRRDWMSFIDKEI